MRCQRLFHALCCPQVGDACLLAIVIDNLGNRYHQVRQRYADADGRHGFASTRSASVALKLLGAHQLMACQGLLRDIPR